MFTINETWGSHRSSAQDSVLLGCDAASLDVYFPNMSRTIMPLASGLTCLWRGSGTTQPMTQHHISEWSYIQHFCFMPRMPHIQLTYTADHKVHQNLRRQN